MANDPITLPPGVQQTLTRLEQDVRNLNVATIAAALITAAGRPHSIEEVMEIHTNLYFAMYAGDLAGHGAYQAWAKDKASHLKKVWK